jgi:XTP/dITP diphosphohydrolase
MELIFATNNPNKVKEVAALLRDNIVLKPLAETGITEDIPEEADTLEGNALQKARYVFERTGKDCFADDTGLEIEALDGAPGVISARYAGEHCSPDDNMDKVLSELKGSENRKANFRTVIALILDGKEHLFEGAVDGKILESQSGAQGFGYDPIFLPNGFELSFAEMELSEKNKISHRGRAVKKLAQFLNEV